MLQKLTKSAVDASPLDLPPPPTNDQMIVDLHQLRCNDPILQLAPLDCFLAELEVADVAPVSVSTRADDLAQNLSKLSSLCDEIRDAKTTLDGKRAELKKVTAAATAKREELESVVSWTTAEVENENGDENTQVAIDDK